MSHTASKLRHALRAIGPAITPVSPLEALRAGFGAFVGLAVAGLFVLQPGLDLRTGLFLIAPFGATSVLLFAVPNSPLAQPWSAIVGNGIAAVIGVACVLAVPDPALRVALAVGGSIAAMLLIRAAHPPAGAVAMTAALSPDTIHALGFRFALTPVIAGTVLLVLLAALWARMTGRSYPFRQFDDRAPTPPPAARLDLSETELENILQRYRQSLNLGTADLARLIGAAELQAASHRAGPLTAADIMSRDLITVGPDTPLSEVAALFCRHGFTALPVVQAGDKFLGVIFQIHLIRRAGEDAARLKRGFGPAMARLLGRESPARAADVMSVAGPRAVPSTPVGGLLPMLADGGCDAVPVLERGRIRGIVTRTDMIAALARETLRRP